MNLLLKFQSVFDIIGPVMIGPSSSHTAGAVRIGKLSLQFDEDPTEVEFQLFNSFAKPIVVTGQTWPLQLNFRHGYR